MCAHFFFMCASFSTSARTQLRGNVGWEFKSKSRLIYKRIFAELSVGLEEFSDYLYPRPIHHPDVQNEVGGVKFKAKYCSSS